MPHVHKKAALAVVSVVLSVACAFAEDNPTALTFFANTNATQNDAPVTKDTALIEPMKAASNTSGKQSKPGLQTTGKRRGAVEKQIASVSTACLKPTLMNIVSSASQHFGSAAVITSGYRAGRRSYHGKCMAADVQIAGVAPSTLARYFRGQSGVGGVGTYGHTRSVHVDVAPRTYTWHHGRRKGRIAALDTGCPCCAGLRYSAGQSLEKNARGCLRAPGGFEIIKLGSARA